MEPGPGRRDHRHGLAGLARSAWSPSCDERPPNFPPRPTTAPTCPRSSPSARSPTGAAPSASRARSTRRSTSSSTTTGSASTVEGIEHVPATGGALLVSNHAGALPPDAAMIAKAIKTEHPRPRAAAPHRRALLQGLSGALPCSCRSSAASPPTRPTCTGCSHDEEQLVLVFPEGRKGTEKLYKDRYRLRRFGRGGFVESAMRAQSADRPGRGRRRRGGDAGLRPRPAAAEAHRPHLLPDHAAFPWLGLLGGAGYLPGEVLHPLPGADPDRPVGRRAVGRQGPRADGRRGGPRAASRRSSTRCSPTAASVWLG